MRTIQFVRRELKDVDLFAWTCTLAKRFRQRFRRRTPGIAVDEEYHSSVCRYLGAGRAATRDEVNVRYQGVPAVQCNVWFWLTFGSWYAEGKR